MAIANFLNSSLGMYIVQSFLHSLIAAVIVDRSIQIWDIANPSARQRFRFIVVVLPVISFPVYQAINPDRGTVFFRLEALFDTGRWLNMELWGTIPIGYLFMLIVFITTLIFVVQELVPVLKHMFESNGPAPDMRVPDGTSPVMRALEGLPLQKPEVFIIEDDALILFSSTGKRPAIFVSTGLMEAFSPGQLRAALAHETAHILRSKRPLLIIIFFLRVLMFFNPVVLLEFRRIVQDEEKVCDDFALSMTQDSRALSETLKMLHPPDAGQGPGARKLSAMMTAIEEYSHRSLLESRIARLEKGPSQNRDKGWAELIVTAASILMLNYFIV